MRVAATIKLTQEQRETLTRLVKGRRTEVRIAIRAKIVLAAARGLENREIAEKLGVTRETVGRWRSRFVEKSVEGILKDLPRGGRKPTNRSGVEGRIIQMKYGDDGVDPSKSDHGKAVNIDIIIEKVLAKEGK